jgi:hypothetical protein
MVLWFPLLCCSIVILCNIYLFGYYNRSGTLKFNSKSFHYDPVFLELRSTNFMSLIPRDGSLKWSIIFLCNALLMSWSNFIMVFPIWIINVGNGGNGVEMHSRGIFPIHSLLQIFINSLT